MLNSAILVIHPTIGSSLFDLKMNFTCHFCKQYYNSSTSTLICSDIYFSRILSGNKINIAW